MKKTGQTGDSPKRTEDGQLRHALDAAGWRYTRQRAAVFNYLCSVHTHPTAEDVYQTVRRSIANISLATVYKCLEALVACKLASKIATGDGPARYDCRTDNHYHFRCLRSHEVRDLELAHDANLLTKLDPELLERLEKQGFHVTDYRLELLGYLDPKST